jgi:hypothetical protein
MLIQSKNMSKKFPLRLLFTQGLHTKEDVPILGFLQAGINNGLNDGKLFSRRLGIILPQGIIRLFKLKS